MGLLTRSLLPAKTWTLAGFVALYALLAIWGGLAPEPWDDDCIGRFYNARHAIEDPAQFIHLWNRPLAIFCLVGPAQWGSRAIPPTMALLAVFTCFATYRYARHRNLPMTAMVIPFLAFQAFYFPIATHALAEPIAAALIAGGLLCLAEKRYLLFALLGGLLPLARLELTPLLAIWAVILLRRGAGRFAYLLLLPLGLWNLAGWALEGDPLWLYNQTIGGAPEANRYGQTAFGHYFRRYAFVLGPVVFYFFFLGFIVRLKRRNIDAFVFLQFTAGFLIYVLFSWNLTLGHAAGFLRHLIVLAPLAAILALEGLALWLRGRERTSLWIASALCIAVIALFCSRKMIDHHTITATVEYVKLAIVILLAAGLLVPLARQRPRIVAGIVAVLCVTYTLATESPRENVSDERRAMRMVADWYTEAGLSGSETYANHMRFFHAAQIDPYAPNIHPLTRANLAQAGNDAIVIWENHYSQRLHGDVRIEHLKNNPTFTQIGHIRTPDQSFSVYIFQKQQQDLDDLTAGNDVEHAVEPVARRE